MTVVAETERLILRPWGTDELETLRGIIGDAQTMSTWPAPMTEAEIQDWYESARMAWTDHRLGRWAIVRKADGVVMGDCGLRMIDLFGERSTDLGYVLHASHQRQGYAIEAARAALQYGIGLGLINITCHMAKDNVRSRRVAEKLGLVQTRSFIHPGNLNKLHLVYAWKPPAQD